MDTVFNGLLLFTASLVCLPLRCCILPFPTFPFPTNSSMSKCSFFHHHRQHLPNGPANGCCEEIVYDGIGSAVQRCQTLDKCRNCNCFSRDRNESIHLEQIPDEIRTPANDEHCTSLSSESWQQPSVVMSKDWQTLGHELHKVGRGKFGRVEGRRNHHLKSLGNKNLDDSMSGRRMRRGVVVKDRG